MKCLPASVWLLNETPARRRLAAVWLERGESTFFIRSAHRGVSFSDTREGVVMKVLIGVDPHKGSHTAVAIDSHESPLGEVRVRATKRQCEALLTWAEGFPERRWAIESAGGLGYLLAQQLVAAGEDVVDVPPTLSARVRVLGSGKAQKNDPNDALSTAIAALRGRRLRPVRADDHAAILRMLGDRHHDLTALRTQAICRLHAQLAALIPGGAARELTAERARTVMRTIHPADRIVTERRRQTADLIADVARLDIEIKDIKLRTRLAVQAAKTSLLDLHGVGPIVAAVILGHSGDVTRFASRHHYASYNGTAPLEASSGPKKRHRLNTRGNRQLNHAIHMIAISQIRSDTAGRAYYQRKIDERKSKKEALRALKRRISDAVYRQLLIDADRAQA
jgi:transposase